MKRSENLSDRIKIFEEDLADMVEEKHKQFAIKMIEQLPDYFFEVPASSTGKYHPRVSLGSGGLVRHTKFAVKIARDLLNLEYNQTAFSPTERDAIICGLILHDGFKHGLADKDNGFTSADHPIVVSNFINGQTVEEDLQEFQKLLVRVTASHMGQWNTDFKSKKEILPKPSDNVEMFVHMCDYIASRRYLDIDFDGNPYDPTNYNTSRLKTEIDKLINLCKSKVAEGYDRLALYDIIAELNNGNKNPNSITDIEVVNNITAKISELNHEK